MSQAETITTLEALKADGQGVRVEFQKTGDRFSHTIFSVTAEGTQPILKSIEGTPNETAPPSPPFAELHQQDDVIFLSGATTLGHWSMSVQADEGRLHFDAACRIKSPLSPLGSSYQQLAQNSNIDADNAATSVTQDRLHIAPNTPVSPGFPTTVQWRYSVSALPDS